MTVRAPARPENVARRAGDQRLGAEPRGVVVATEPEVVVRKSTAPPGRT